MDLSGTWRAAPAREELRRTFHQPALDDRHWVRVAVPGPWAEAPELAGERSVLHRRRFSTTPLEKGHRRWLCLDGIVQQGDIWLDGAYVGDTDGYFVPHRFEVTDLLADTDAHLLAIDATVPTVTGPDDRSDLTGALLDPELVGANAPNPGGIQRRVWLHDTGPIAIRHFRAVCAAATSRRATLALRAVLDHPDGGPVTLRTRVSGVDHELRHTAAAGENRVEWTVEVPDPDLWWPHALGDQPLHDLICSVEAQGMVHDRRSRRVGFRSIALDRWTVVVNGERLFSKGVAVLPNPPQPDDAGGRQAEADVRTARALGFDLVRTVAHVSHPRLYDAADEAGMLVWQDMPLRGVMARSVRTQAVRQARELVDLLGHHPSVAVWCAHDEPFRRPTTRGATPPIVGQQRPSWNRSVLDPSVRRVLQRTDGSRPIVANTAVPPHLPRLDGTTSHLWFGWHDQRVDDLAPALARLPRMARFVTAFGAATLDPGRVEAATNDWPDADWEGLAAAVGATSDALQHLTSPHEARDAARWAQAGALAQADLLRRTIETLRRLKYRPTGGFCAFALADVSPAGGFGLLDHQRRAKPSRQAVADACRPVIVTADLPTTATRPRTTTLIHVVSDLRAPLDPVEVTAVLHHPDGTSETRGWVGAVAADSVEGVATLPMRWRGTGIAVLHLSLVATGPDGPLTADNRYSVAVR